MIHRVYAQFISLLVGLTLALAVGADEHKAPTEHGAEAHKPIAVTAVKPSSSAPVTAVERKRPEVVLRTRHSGKPSGGSPPVRFALKTNPGQGDDPTSKTPSHQVVGQAPHAPHWSYEGETGPHAWARLAPEFAKCGNGARQSPIDIRDGMKLDLEQITFDYRPSSFRVIDNGHTIQANVGGWNSIRVMGRRFMLVQFHFHSPSEETIDGRQYDMVAHLVHKDNEGKLAVVAVLIERGARQPAIQTVLNNLPLEKGEEIAASTTIDLNQLLPENRKYFTYMGSLTTPPCSEGVLWIVMKQPVQATLDQLSLFARMYPMNARPIQAAGGRVIKESN
jgi:carbonic anhydrase